MCDNSSLIATLDERRETYSAQFKAGLGGSLSKIQQTLEALDHPASFYCNLSSVERELLREQWLSLFKTHGGYFQQKIYTKPKPRVIPPQVIRFFGDAACIPQRPRATDDYEQGTLIRSWKDAVKMRIIQLNPPGLAHWLIFDCDHSEQNRWQSRGLPEPSFITVNPANGHHHVVYRLSEPVCTTERGRQKPICYMRAIQEALRIELEGDPGYVGLLTQNPLHPAWQVIRSEVMPSYSLSQLAAGRTLTAKRRRLGHAATEINLARVEIGRNTALFHAVRSWAYVNDIDQDDVIKYAQECNALFPCPLGQREVQMIARSIAKYCGQNSSQKTRHRSEFIARQSARGKRGGRPVTTRDSKPWLSEGISRATWYRRAKLMAQTPENA